MRLIDNEYRVLREENNRLKHNHRSMEERVAENKEKIKLNNQLPYLVGNIVEVLDNTDVLDEEELEDMDEVGCLQWALRGLKGP